MRIGAISDVHGNYEALLAVLRKIDNEGVDLIINSGDDIGYSAFPDECVSMLAEREIVSVMGNYDEAGSMFYVSERCADANDETNRIRFASLRWTQEKILDKTRKYLSSLPARYEFETGFGRALMLHGGLENLVQWITENDSDLLEDIAVKCGTRLVIMGHTHKPFSKQINNTLFVNPGAVGRPFDGDPRASFAVIDVGDDIRVRFRRVEYDVEKNVKALITAGLPPEIGVMLRKGRDSHLA